MEQDYRRESKVGTKKMQLRTYDTEKMRKRVLSRDENDKNRAQFVMREGGNIKDPRGILFCW